MGNWVLFPGVDAQMPNTGATLSGVLEKQSDVLKKWNPRFFSLDVRNPRTLRGRSVVMYLRAHTCVDVPEDSQLQGPYLKYWRGEEASGKEAGDPPQRVLLCTSAKHCGMTGSWMLGLNTSFSTFSTTACMSSVDYGAGRPASEIHTRTWHQYIILHYELVSADGLRFRNFDLAW